MIFTNIALLLLLVLVMRRTRAKPTPAIHIHPCITLKSSADLEQDEKAIRASIDQIGWDKFK